MQEFIDAVELFIEIVDNLKAGLINLKSSLDEMVLKTYGENFAYIDNRKEAKEKYSFDFWHGEEDQELNEKILYSRSDQFPDFLCKTKSQDTKLIRGSLLELKDSKSGNIASFNSTIPTKYKNLEEINTINGNNLVSKIAAILDGNLALNDDYYSFQRRVFYLVRTHKDSINKVKISIVDGSFFETVPKEHLIHQMLLNILNKDDRIPEELIAQIEKYLPSDQSIIVASQNIEKASVRPRLRIMAEVHAEGNPHSRFYPEISDQSFNLILQESDCGEEITEVISKKLGKIERFTIQHKRNGKHIVFQYRFQ